jgi:HPt (histidine-containing phosphotransfer) domain-containing protein
VTDQKNQNTQLFIDCKANSDKLQITEEIYLRILKKAIQQTNGDYKGLKEAFAVHDFERIQSISHRLKGDYDNLRIQEMSSLAKQINENVMGELDLQKLKDWIQQFGVFLEQLKLQFS